MGDLSKNFNRKEFACKGDNCCGGSAPVDNRLVEALQILRTMLGARIRIRSGFRCVVHNTAVGGAVKSTHPNAQGVDIVVEGHTPSQVKKAAEQIPAFKNGGIGIYDDFCHLDIRKNGPARWDRRTNKDDK